VRLRQVPRTDPLSGAEYKKLRRIPTHFAVLLGHDVPAVERVIARNTRYVVVEKFGEAAIAANSTQADPPS
jgi:hypothetical protein